MDISWGCGWFLATMFVVINLVGQLGGVALVMTRFRVEIACGVLFFIVVLQVRGPLLRSNFKSILIRAKRSFFLFFFHKIYAPHTILKKKQSRKGVGEKLRVS